MTTPEETGPRGDARAPALVRLRRFLTHSQRLPDATWRLRHLIIVAIAAAHVPVIYLAATVVNHRSVLHGMVDAGAIAVLSALAVHPAFRRGLQEAFATLALVTCSAMVVHVAGGSIEAHFHFFVVIAVVALYQSWPAFLLALAYVVVHHGVLGAISPSSVYNHPAAIANPWLWALIHAAFVLAASSVYVVMWRLNEAARNESRDLYRKLYEGERSLVIQLREAAQMKDELVSVVSHELRTPLTSILGFAQLLDDEDAGTECDRKDWTKRILKQGERLNFLIDNLMRFRAHAPDASAVTEVGKVLDEVIDEYADQLGGDPVPLGSIVQNGLVVRTSESALRLMVSNLVNNAVKHRLPGSPIDISAHREDVGPEPIVAISVSNRSVEIREEDRTRMFSAFVQLDSSVTRRVAGVGLGLYIVRETATAHGGSVDVHYADDRVTFTVRLPAAAPASQISAA